MTTEKGYMCMKGSFLGWVSEYSPLYVTDRYGGKKNSTCTAAGCPAPKKELENI
ncbi:MAG: hypothetical protein QXY90_04940 [Candidatus Anstonellales archaeon]